MVLVGRLLLAIAVVCAGIGIAAQFGRINEIADALNHGAPYWAAVGLASGVISGILLRQGSTGRWAIAALVAGTVAAFCALPTAGAEVAAAIQPRATPKATDENSLKIITFNVWKHNRTPEKAADWLLSQDADIIVLMEASGRGAEIAARVRARYPFRTTCYGTADCSTQIFSRVPPVAFGGLSRGDAENRGTLNAGWARFADPTPFTLVATHLDRPWPWGRQEAERAELARFVRTQDPATTIVVGDFNTTGWTFAGQAQDRLLGLPRLTRALPTWGEFLPRGLRLPVPVIGIDHVYAGPGWAPAAIQAGPPLGSDHRAVVAKLIHQ